MEKRQLRRKKGGQRELNLIFDFFFAKKKIKNQI
jgi:hypothetical protein